MCRENFYFARFETMKYQKNSQYFGEYPFQIDFFNETKQIFSDTSRTSSR